MNIARFTHVSEAQYAEAMQGQACLPLTEIPLPKRATAGSAGYDFVSPLEVTVGPGETALIPTGIRAEMEQGIVNLKNLSSGEQKSFGKEDLAGILAFLQQ